MSRRPSITRLCNRCHTPRSSCSCPTASHTTDLKQVAVTCPADNCNFTTNRNELKVLAAHVNGQHSNTSFDTASLAPSGLASCPYCHRVFSMARGWILHSRGCAAHHRQSLTDILPGSWPRPGWLWSRQTRTWAQVTIQVSSSNPTTSFQVQAENRTAEERKACLVSLTNPTPAQTQHPITAPEIESESSTAGNPHNDESGPNIGSSSAGCRHTDMSWIAYPRSNPEPSSSDSDSQPMDARTTRHEQDDSESRLMEARRIRHEQDELYRIAVEVDLAAAASAAAAAAAAAAADAASAPALTHTTASTYDTSATTSTTDAHDNDPESDLESLLDDDLGEESDTLTQSQEEPAPTPCLNSSDVEEDSCILCYGTFDPMTDALWACCSARVCTTCTITVRTSDNYECPFCRGGRTRADSCAICLGPVSENATILEHGEIGPAICTHRAHSVCATRASGCPICSGSSRIAVNFFSPEPQRIRQVVAQCVECWQDILHGDQTECLTCECWSPSDLVHEACAILHRRRCDPRNDAKQCCECNSPIYPPDLPVQPSNECGRCFSSNTYLHQTCLTWHEQQHTRCPLCNLITLDGYAHHCEIVSEEKSCIYCDNETNQRPRWYCSHFREWPDAHICDSCCQWHDIACVTGRQCPGCEQPIQNDVLHHDGCRRAPPTHPHPISSAGVLCPNCVMRFESIAALATHLRTCTDTRQISLGDDFRTFLTAHNVSAALENALDEETREAFMVAFRRNHQPCCVICAGPIDPLNLGEWACCAVPSRPAQTCRPCTITIRTSDTPGCPLCRTPWPRARSCAVCLGPCQDADMFECGHRAHQQCGSRLGSCPACNGLEPITSFLATETTVRRPIGFCPPCVSVIYEGDETQSLPCNCWEESEQFHTICANAHTCDSNLCAECRQPIVEGSPETTPGATLNCRYCFATNARLHLACAEWHAERCAGDEGGVPDLGDHSPAPENYCLLCGGAGDRSIQCHHYGNWPGSSMCYSCASRHNNQCDQGQYHQCQVCDEVIEDVTLLRHTHCEVDDPESSIPPASTDPSPSVALFGYESKVFDCPWCEAPRNLFQCSGCSQRIEMQPSTANDPREATMHQAFMDGNQNLFLAMARRDGSHGAVNRHGDVWTSCPSCNASVEKVNRDNPRCDTIRCECGAHFCHYCTTQRDPGRYNEDHHGMDHFGHWPSDSGVHGATGGWCLLRNRGTVGTDNARRGRSGTQRAGDSVPRSLNDLMINPPTGASDADELAGTGSTGERTGTGPAVDTADADASTDTGGNGNTGLPGADTDASLAGAGQRHSTQTPQRSNTISTQGSTQNPGRRAQSRARRNGSRNTGPTNDDPGGDSSDTDPQPEHSPRAGRPRQPRSDRNRSRSRARSPGGEPAYRARHRRARAIERQRLANRARTNCLRAVPRELWASFAECCAQPLSRFAEASALDDADTMYEATKEFLELVPRLLAVSRGGRGKSRRRNLAVVRRNINEANERMRSSSDARYRNHTSTTSTIASNVNGERELTDLTSEEVLLAPAILRSVGLERSGHTSRAVRALDSTALMDASSPVSRA